ncbi:MAG: indole-3-glycerol phosphate synthase TrpC, partial [Pyrinomonadaceae bacterium]
MKGTILEKIIDAKRVHVEAAKRTADMSRLVEDAQDVRTKAQSHRLREALSDRSRINLIAEFKRASPSKGVINDSLDPVMAAINYEKGGAASISVLTEEDFFKGSIDDLKAIRKAVDLPILRKDFTIDEFQIYESAAAGADAILLIVAVLTPNDLNSFIRLTEDDLK